jgi:hemerythrin
MPLVIWSDSLSVGVPAIDEQHKRLVGMLNALHESMLEGRAPDVLARVLDQLVDYTVYHFNAEQRLFAQHAYPGASKHAQLHAELTTTARRLHADVAGGRKMVSTEALQFLRDWLKMHILSEDKAFGQFVTSCAGPSAA